MKCGEKLFVLNKLYLKFKGLYNQVLLDIKVKPGYKGA